MIGFALPWALLGLAAAALPLLLHLVRRHEAPEVVFPAVRYLEDATRDQLRRLKFRHWLLLILRTLLIVALVLAAAGTTIRRNSFGPHAPSALVLIVDNSAASGAVIDGEALLAALLRAANQVLGRATLSDRVWLITADGVGRPGTPTELRGYLAALHSQPVRLDLGRAVSTAHDLIRASGRTGHIVVISAVQRSALSAASGDGSVLVLRPGGAPPANRAVIRLDAGLQPWGTSGGRVTISIASSDTTPVPVTLSVGGRTAREVLVTPGVPSVQRIGPQPIGWTLISAALPPDEFRLDDTGSVAVRVAPPVAVQWDAGDRYVAAAADVLVADGRLRSGGDVHLGMLAAGTSVVMPPDDPARVGALNRSLAARGIPWQFGTARAASEQTDSGAVMPARESVIRRYTLNRAGTAGEVLATVSGTPWLVRGNNVLLLGSRLDPSWTALPLSAAFVPFVDAVVTAVVHGEATAPDLIVGQAYRLPEQVTGVIHDGVTTRVQGGTMWLPPVAGVFHLLGGADTVGDRSVRIDSRVSDLSRASDREVSSLWHGAIVAGLRDGPALTFATGGRADLTELFLMMALVCALIETALVTAKGAGG